VRLFIAVWPPPAAVEQLRALPRPELPNVRWTRPDQWHATLRFLGRVKGEERDRLDAIWGSTTLSAAPVAVMGPATSAFGGRVLHVPVAGLDELASVVTSATDGVGQPPEPRAFLGHITLARGSDLRSLTGAPVRATWTVEEITLVASEAGRYEVLRRRPL